MHEAAVFATIEAGEEASVRDLLTRGANPHVSTSDGWTALVLAIDAARARVQKDPGPRRAERWIVEIQRSRESLTANRFALGPQ